MTDPIEPPDLDAWKRRAETAEAALAIADRNARNRGQVADEAVTRALAAEAERDRLRRALQRIVDWTDLKPTNVRRGGVRDFVREVLSTSPATTSPDPEEPNP